MAIAAFALIAAASAFSGCADILNSLLDNAAPKGVTASKGDYPDRIQVSWSPPDLSSQKWQGYSVYRYLVTWSGPIDESDFTSDTSYSIYVPPADVAMMFDVKVTAILTGGGQDGGSSGDSGFAMNASPLVWYDGGGEYQVSGSDAWFETMLQPGFSYNFAFAGRTTATVEFYAKGTLGPVLGTAGPPASPSWTCDSQGSGNRFYVHVIPSSAGAQFTASYGF